MKPKTVDEIPVPVRVGNGKMVRYKTAEADIAIENDNNTFYVYDVQSSAISTPLERAQINKVLRQYNEGQKALKRENIKPTEAVEGNLVSKDEHMAYVGKSRDGKSIYKSNFQQGTPKSAKSEKILNYIQNVWSKKPISLVISNGETSRTILAQFDPTVDKTHGTPTDASKIAGGNRHGNHTEQRVTLDLADDYYQIASESKYNYSKEEVGKSSAPHRDVLMWHYFIDDIYFAEHENDELTPYRVTINVKEKQDGSFVYSFNAEKTKESTTRQTLHAAVSTRKGTNGELFIDSIPNFTEKVNTSEQNSQEKSQKTPGKTKYQLEAEQNDALLREKLGEKYTKLTEPNKGMIRKIMRQAKAKGMSEADALMLARVSAHSGVDITVSKEMCMRYKLDKDGNPEVNENGKKLVWYADGYYDSSTGKVIVNPEATRADMQLLIHEFLHASTRASTGRRNKRTYNKLLKVARESLTGDQLKQIKKDYGAVYKGDKAKIDEDIIAESSEIFASEQFINSLISDEPTLFKKMLSFFKGASEYYQDDPRLSKQARRFYKLYKKLYNNLAQQRQNTNASSVVVGGNEENFAMPKEVKRITADMSDDERYEVLKDKKITAPLYEGEADALIAGKKEALESKKIDFAKAAIVQIAEKLKIIKSEINFKDIEVKIVLSNSNLRESVTKEATPKQIAKLLPVLAPAAENSFVIERHDNRYYFDTDTVYFDNLLGAYVDGEYLVPVRFGLKHSRTGATTLYVVVNQNKIAIENLGEIKNDRGLQDASPDLTGVNSLRRSVTYSISQIIPFVNSKDLLRYLPDNMLFEEQRLAKWTAIAETIKYTNEKNDRKYGEYIKNGDMRSVVQMVSAAARAAGYTVNAYHGTDNEFTVFDIGKAKSKTGSGFYGRGFYFSTSRTDAENYGETIKPVYLRIGKVLDLDSSTWTYDLGLEKRRKRVDVVKTKIEHAENGFINIHYITKDAPTVWKSISHVSSMQITGDETGKTFVEHKLNPESSILPRDVKNLAELAQTNGFNSIKGAGTNIGDVGTEYVVFEPEQVKSADPITYDDKDNIIPLSERFNPENNDIRYAMPKNAKGIEIYTEEQYNSFDDLYTATDDFAREVLTADRSSFARSLANRTTGMKKGETRTLVILGASSRAYCFRADSYMHGEMIKTFEANNNEILESIANEYDTIDKSTENASLWTQTVQSLERRSDSFSSIFSRERPNSADILYADSPEGNGTGDSERSRSDYKYDKRETEDLIKQLKELYNINYSLPKNAKPEPLKVPDYEIAYGSVAEQTRPRTLMDYVADAAYSTAHPVKTAKTLGDRGLEWTGSALIGTQIAFVNEQAGYENAMKRMGRTDGEATVQAVRAASNRAQSMLGETQAIKQNGKLVEVGDGWQKIVSRVKSRGENAFDLFEHYLFHRHNVDRMSLKERSIARNEADKQKLAEVEKRIAEANREIKECNAKIVFFVLVIDRFVWYT